MSTVLRDIVKKGGNWRRRKRTMLRAVSSNPRRGLFELWVVNRKLPHVNPFYISKIFGRNARVSFPGFIVSSFHSRG